MAEEEANAERLEEERLSAKEAEQLENVRLVAEAEEEARSEAK